MVMVQKTFSYYAAIYFILLVFGGAFLFLNLTLAVLKFHFTKVMNEYRNEEKIYLTEEELEDSSPEKESCHIGVFFNEPKRMSRRFVHYTIEGAQRGATPEKYVLSEHSSLDLEQLDIRDRPLRSPNLDQTQLSHPGSGEDSRIEGHE